MPEPKWILGTVVEKLGDISYRVQVGDQVWTRHMHVDQFLQTSISQMEANHSATVDDDLLQCQMIVWQANSQSKQFDITQVD